MDTTVGDSGYKTLYITRNLAEALPYLRYKGKPRVLWIDAICVNQTNLEERSRQVTRMVNIYSKAARVIVWLGFESENTSAAMNCFQEIVSTSLWAMNVVKFFQLQM